MEKFVLSSPYLERVRTFTDCDSFSLVINDRTIIIPIVTAISISETIKKMYSFDKTITSIRLNADLVTETLSLDIFENILNGIPISLPDDTRDLFTLGRLIGNNDIAALAYKKYESCMSTDNVLDLVSMKLEVAFPIDKEVSFIAKHFMETPNLLKWMLVNASKNIDVLESIITSSDLSIPSEDDLIQFIIKLCNESPKCYRLLGCVYLEYASKEMCEIYVDFINSIELNLAALNSIWLAAGNKLKMDVSPQPKKIARHNGKIFYNSTGKEITSIDKRKGILAILGLTDQVSVTSSSVSSGTPSDLIAGDSTAHFFTNDIANSWVQFDVYDYTVIPTSYMICGSIYSNDDNRLQSWELLGKKENDEWVLLDKHNNEPFHSLEIKEFNISVLNKMKSFRLEVTGPSIDGGNRLCINQFDVFGSMYEE